LTPHGTRGRKKAVIPSLIIWGGRPIKRGAGPKKKKRGGNQQPFEKRSGGKRAGLKPLGGVSRKNGGKAKKKRLQKKKGRGLAIMVLWGAIWGVRSPFEKNAGKAKNNNLEGIPTKGGGKKGVPY